MASNSSDHFDSVNAEEVLQDSNTTDSDTPSFLACKQCGTNRPHAVAMSRGGLQWIRYKCGNCNRLLTSNRTQRVSGPCAICGKPVTRYRSQMEGTGSVRLYCSRRCFGISRRENPERIKPKSEYKNASWWRARWQRLRLRAMARVNPGLRCECGCNVLSILQISHDNGGGSQEMKEVYDNDQRRFWRAIVSGERSVRGLALRCKVCTILHYVQMKGIRGHKVTYSQKIRNARGRD